MGYVATRSTEQHSIPNIPLEVLAGIQSRSKTSEYLTGESCRTHQREFAFLPRPRPQTFQPRFTYSWFPPYSLPLLLFSPIFRCRNSSWQPPGEPDPVCFSPTSSTPSWSNPSVAVVLFLCPNPHPSREGVGCPVPLLPDPAVCAVCTLAPTPLPGPIPSLARQAENESRYFLDDPDPNCHFQMIWTRHAPRPCPHQASPLSVPSTGTCVWTWEVRWGVGGGRRHVTTESRRALAVGGRRGMLQGCPRGDANTGRTLPSVRLSILQQLAANETVCTPTECCDPGTGLGPGSQR